LLNAIFVFVVLSSVNFVSYINKKEFSGRFTFEENAWDQPLIDAELDDSVLELPFTITEEEPVLWDVVWEINLP